MSVCFVGSFLILGYFILLLSFLCISNRVLDFAFLFCRLKLDDYFFCGLFFVFGLIFIYIVC